jgi:hypothetical protein
MKQIRYTQGPDELSLGAIALTRSVWFGPVDDATAKEAQREERVAEFGFEVQDIPDATEQPAAPAKRNRAATEE